LNPVIRATGPGLGEEGQVLSLHSGEWVTVSKEEYLANTNEPIGAAGRQVATANLVLILMRLVIPFAGVFLVLFRFVNLKAIVMKQLKADTSFVPATVEQFSAMNRELLDAKTKELEALGFERIGEYSLVRNVQPVVPAFMRLMVNKKEKCFAEVQQLFPPNRPATPVMIAVMSMMSEGWTLSTGMVKPKATGYIMRRPRGVSQVVLGGSAAQMVQEHLAMRSQMMAELGIWPMPDTTADGYFRAMNAMRQDRIRTVNSRSSFGMWADMISFKIKPRYGWKGAWESKLPQRPAMPAQQQAAFGPAGARLK
jgi:hypothetical protein